MLKKQITLFTPSEELPPTGEVVLFHTSCICLGIFDGDEWHDWSGQDRDGNNIIYQTAHVE